MDHFATWAADDNNDDDVGRLLGANSPRDTTIQIVLSATLGISAFLAFCFLRPRWTGLYAARKVQKDEATALPNLPDTFFGWILPLWRITDQQVLASAGLDAYVFLAFFKMAIKFLAITLFFSLVVIKPVHDAYPEDEDTTHGNKTSHHNSTKGHDGKKGSLVNLLESSVMSNHSRPSFSETFENDYLWMYLAFAYLFTTIIIYLIISETRRIIEVRQEYLGTQTTATDRTIRLSGIPAELQEETKIKEFVESLDIGKVESVFLVRKIGELDEAMAARMVTLRKLEEAYVIHAARRTVEQNLGALPVVQPPEPLIDHVSEEDDGSPQDANGHSAPAPLPQTVRPTTTIRFGFLKMHSKQVDAIAYYETMLKEQDERVMELRKQHFDPTPLAFVTMDSVAACQMAIQAVLDPSPLSLIANQSPAPSDIIWPNTYLSRRSRMFRSWSVTALIVLLTIFWSVIFVPIAGLLNTDTIGKIFPQIGTFLEDHKNARSLVNTQLPTLIASLLTVLVPYMYYYLSWYQGMIAQGDIELSAISKNFFFTFFNFFVIFTVLGTASKFYQFFERFGDAIQDPSRVAYTLAQSLQRLLTFYVNFIILQGIGLFPFRLLEIGSVSLYPLFLMGAKTPRDYAELEQPPMFIYSFYLPTALLIFIICLVYSVLRASWSVLLAGLAYFLLGHFVYKYQLLYAMDHQQQSTGRAWGMICDRIFLGLVFFQLTTAGQLILMKAVTRSLLLLPLVFATIWISVVYGRTYKPLMQFIALRSVKRGEHYTDDVAPAIDAEVDAESDAASGSETPAPERNVWAADGGDGPQLKYYRETRRGRDQVVYESPQKGMRFINPSLVAPLQKLWIAGDTDVGEQGSANGGSVTAIADEEDLV